VIHPLPVDAPPPARLDVIDPHRKRKLEDIPSSRDNGRHWRVLFTKRDRRHPATS
jgi:hypothetical protein